MRGQEESESEEYGVGSFVFRARRPFHPERLSELLEGDWPGVLDEESLRRDFTACLLTDEEMEAGPEAWSQMTDPFPAWVVDELEDESASV